MKDQSFREWMQGRYTPSSAATRLSAAKKVEEYYGDLDAHIDAETIENVINNLHYSLTDSKKNLSNPTLIPVSGSPYNVLNNCKNGVRTYVLFRNSGGDAEIAQEAVIELAAAGILEKKQSKIFELEVHLQRFLRDEIDQLETGLTIVDGGVERSVESGDIDILAQDENSRFVVIELKRDLARRDTIGQITGYMGDIMEEESSTGVRGIIVAGDFDKSCRSAVRAIPNLTLKKYRFSFQFEEVD